MVTVISLPGQMVSVATAQLCHCSMKAVTGNREVSGHGCVSIKLYRAAGQGLDLSCGLPLLASGLCMKFITLP